MKAKQKVGASLVAALQIFSIFAIAGCSPLANSKAVSGLPSAVIEESLQGSLEVRVPVITATDDSLRFKEEYEALNTVLDDQGKNRHSFLSIDGANAVVFLTFDELLDFIDHKTGLLYFGRPACPWCRLLVTPLLEYAAQDRVPVYYYDIEQDRDENNEKYKTVLSLLGEYLPTDTVTQKESDPDFDPDLKRVVLPQLFFMENGKVKSEICMYQHEFLSNHESDKVMNLLRFMYDSIDQRLNSSAELGDCGEC